MHVREPGEGQASRPARDPKECYDRIRYTLSDENGELRFTSFQIAGGAECRETERELKEYLLSRPLRSLETRRIMRASCPGNRQCIDTVARLVADQQNLFAADDTGTEEEASDAEDESGAR
jgi:hypothetical protein